MSQQQFSVPTMTFIDMTSPFWLFFENLCLMGADLPLEDEMKVNRIISNHKNSIASYFAHEWTKYVMDMINQSLIKKGACPIKWSAFSYHVTDKKEYTSVSVDTDSLPQGTTINDLYDEVEYAELYELEQRIIADISSQASVTAVLNSFMSPLAVEELIKITSKYPNALVA